MHKIMLLNAREYKISTIIYETIPFLIKVMTKAWTTATQQEISDINDVSVSKGHLNMGISKQFQGRRTNIWEQSNYQTSSQYD